MERLPLPPGSEPLVSGPDYVFWIQVAFLVLVTVGAIWRANRWHWFQALVAFAVAVLFIIISKETDVSFNQMSVAAMMGITAYGATLALNWLLTRLRQRRLGDQ